MLNLYKTPYFYLDLTHCNAVRVPNRFVRRSKYDSPNVIAMWEGAVSYGSLCIDGILEEHSRKQFNYKGFEELSCSKWILIDCRFLVNLVDCYELELWSCGIARIK